MNFIAKDFTKSQMNSMPIRKFCKFDRENHAITDLEGAEHIEMKHIVQGIQRRSLDRELWCF